MNRNINKAFNLTTAGNRFGYYLGYYIFTFKRPHGAWCCFIGRKGKYFISDGVHGSWMKNLRIVKAWAKDIINKNTIK